MARPRLAPAAATALLLLAPGGLACTWFSVNTSLPGKEQVIARTMEWDSVPLLTEWQVVVKPRGAMIDASGQGGGGSPSRYGYVCAGFNSFGASELPTDFSGMNEAGLTADANTQYRAQYQSYDPASGKTPVVHMYFVSWVLANFATVQQVKDALLGGQYVVTSAGLPDMTFLHWAIADKSGAQMVVEYERGEPKFYWNNVGVMTNDPFYPYQVEHLNAYTSLTPLDDANERSAPLEVDTGGLLAGQTKVPFNKNHGFNTLGIPGDFSPGSRFVRAFYERQIAMVNAPPSTSDLDGWLALTQGILNSLFITKGLTGPATIKERGLPKVLVRLLCAVVPEEIIKEASAPLACALLYTEFPDLSLALPKDQCEAAVGGVWEEAFAECPKGAQSSNVGLTASRYSIEVAGDHTCFATMRVPQTGFFAYRSYQDMQWQGINTTELDWTRGGRLTMENRFSASVKDVTHALQPALQQAEEAQPAAPMAFLQVRPVRPTLPGGGDEAALLQQRVERPRAERDHGEEI